MLARQTEDDLADFQARFSEADWVDGRLEKSKVGRLNAGVPYPTPFWFLSSSAGMPWYGDKWLGSKSRMPSGCPI
jgi:hypothetical protein